MLREVEIQTRGTNKAGVDDVVVLFLRNGAEVYRMTFTGRGGFARAQQAAGEWEVGTSRWVTEILARG